MKSGSVPPSKYRVRWMRPQNAVASTSPIQNSTGCEVPRKACGKPGALSERTRALRTPGPHHIRSFERPSATPFQSSRRTLSPSAAAEYGPAPKRCGRSMLDP
jgi:hypothetical protein